MQRISDEELLEGIVDLMSDLDFAAGTLEDLAQTARTVAQARILWNCYESLADALDDLDYARSNIIEE